MEEGSYAQYYITNFYLVEGKSRSRYIDALVGQFSCELEVLKFFHNLFNEHFKHQLCSEYYTRSYQVGRKKEETDTNCHHWKIDLL